MVVHGRGRRAEAVGDLLGAQAREDETQTFALAQGQGVEPFLHWILIHTPPAPWPTTGG